MKTRGIPLSNIVTAMERIAPLELAEEWDNVGLLVEPPRNVRAISRILLTIDLTEPVIDEAVKKNVGCIVAYHPPIFDPIQRLTASSPEHRVLLKAVAKHIAVYSPHTALDAVEGGVNDWLADGLGPSRREVLLPSPSTLLREVGDAPAQLSKTTGQGRLITLARAVTTNTLVQRVKKHLKLGKVRLARRQGRPRKVRTVALCAGAGGSVLRGVSADVYLTGEMRHHDVLAAVAGGTTVILSEHTHTERSYLSVLQRRLRKELSGKIAIDISRADREPLHTV